MKLLQGVTLFVIVFVALLGCTPAQSFDSSEFRLQNQPAQDFQLLLGIYDLQRLISAIHYVDFYFLKNDFVNQSPMRYIGYRTENFFGFTLAFG